MQKTGWNRTWPYAFAPRPWEDVSDHFVRLLPWPYAAAMVELVWSIRTETDQLAPLTSMHRLVVTTLPLTDPPYGTLLVHTEDDRDPYSDMIVIEHLSPSGHDERIVRPLAELVPLFWRFSIEKFGVRPARDL